MPRYVVTSRNMHDRPQPLGLTHIILLSYSIISLRSNVHPWCELVPFGGSMHRIQCAIMTDKSHRKSQRRCRSQDMQESTVMHSRVRFTVRWAPSPEHTLKTVGSMAMKAGRDPVSHCGDDGPEHLLRESPVRLPLFGLRSCPHNYPLFP